VRWYAPPKAEAKNCIVYKNVKPTGVKFLGKDMWSEDLSVRMSGDGQAWEAIGDVPTKPCACGISKVDRKCATADKGFPCNSGINHYFCSSSLCQYNAFPGFAMQ
jgi:hypothetical protein